MKRGNSKPTIRDPQSAFLRFSSTDITLEIRLTATYPLCFANWASLHLDALHRLQVCSHDLERLQTSVYFRGGYPNLLMSRVDHRFPNQRKLSLELHLHF